MDNEDKILRAPDLSYEPEGGLGFELFRMMKFHRSNVAQYIEDTEEAHIYGLLLKRSIRVALNLRAQGVSPTDLICLCTYNQADGFVAFIACTFLGVRVACLDPTLSPEDTAHLIQQVRPRFTFVVPEAITLLENALGQAGLETNLVIFGETEEHRRFAEFLEPAEDEDFFEPVKVDAQDTAVIFFSSGTTGLPKGICQSGYALLAQALNFVNNFVLDTFLYYTSLYWISAVIFFIASCLSGNARVVCRKYDPTQVWHLIEKYKITMLFLAPIHVIDMYRSGRPEDIDTSSLVYLLTGGGVLPTNHVVAMRDILPGTHIAHAYGQTEVAGVLTLFPGNKVKDCILLHNKPTSCGRPLSGISYKVVDPETEELLGPHQHGELRVLTRFSMNGYYNLDSSECFDAEGWLKTGDIVYYDEDQCFYVVDRIKEMLKYKSWHIAPAMLENVVHLHPKVKKCVVIGVPDEEDGDHPMAVVLLKEGEEASDIEIAEFVEERVSDRQKLRGGVRFVDFLPLTPSGKVKRQVLKKMVLAGTI